MKAIEQPTPDVDEVIAESTATSEPSWPSMVMTWICFCEICRSVRRQIPDLSRVHRPHPRPSQTAVKTTHHETAEDRDLGFAAA